MNIFLTVDGQSHTFLSGNVRQLICESFEGLECAGINAIEASDCDFTEDGYLLWEKIGTILGHDLINDYSNCDYHDAVTRLHPVCCAVHQELICLQPPEFEMRYLPCLLWTGCEKRFQECFKLLKSPNTADNNLCLLLLTSSLERALSDVYLSYSCAPQCPSLLKDLLATQELKEVFGESVIRLLHLLIGPPSSLNLRNVLWHGFAGPGEVPIQYVSLLLVITASLNVKLKDPPFCLREIKRRPLIALSTCADDKLHSAFPTLELCNMTEIFNLFHSSSFVIPSTLPLWLTALDYFKEQRFDFCVMLLLPQLEHGLRRVFACVNNCPHRVLTAESTVLYTTFDEILAPVLQDGTENLLRQELGDALMEMLLDVLVHSEGPRIRDHISHGEVDLQQISQQLANHILCISIAFAGSYLNSDAGNFPITSRICESAKVYKSLFHPISLLTKVVHNLAFSLLKWKDLPKPSAEEFDILDCDGYKSTANFPNVSRALQAVIMASTILSGESLSKMLPCQFDLDNTDTFFQGCLQILDTASFPTLFRPKGELEIAVLLRSIVKRGKVTFEQICEVAAMRYKQWKNRELRQRQRANYKRLWSHLPFIRAVLQLMVLFVIEELHQLPRNSEIIHRSAFIKFLKRCLQCSENMESLSSKSKNKWDECCTVGETFVDCVHSYYNEHRHKLVS